MTGSEIIHRNNGRGRIREQDLEDGKPRVRMSMGYFAAILKSEQYRFQGISCYRIGPRVFVTDTLFLRIPASCKLRFFSLCTVRYFPNSISDAVGHTGRY